jgi:DNA-binding NarL/FixJ family response regulator
MNVLIIDDHQLFIDGLAYMLRDLSDPLNLVTVNSTELALEQLQSGTDWDLVLLDLIMPGISGNGLLQCMQVQGMLYPVVVISAELNSVLIQQALHFGALGFIPKASPRDMMLAGLRQVLDGEMYIPEELQLALARLTAPGQSDATNLLSKRQSEV